MAQEKTTACNILRVKDTEVSAKKEMAGNKKHIQTYKYSYPQATMLFCRALCCEKRYINVRTQYNKIQYDPKMWSFCT